MKAPRRCERWFGLCLVLLWWVMPGHSAAQEICGKARVELIAAGNIAAGVVDIRHDDSWLYITLSTDGWAILRSQVHVAGTPEEIPQSWWGSLPIVRQVDYAHVYRAPVVTDTYTIALEELGLSPGGAECIDQTLVLSVDALLTPTSGLRRLPVSAWAASTSDLLWEQPRSVEYDLRCCVAARPVIQVDPASHDFGERSIGCEVEQSYTVLNIGSADLVIHDVELATGSADFSFDLNEGPNGELPWTVPPGLGLEVFVRYAPLDEFEDTAFLTVFSSDPLHPEVMVTARGTGTFYAEQVDVFEQKGGMVDILFTLDRSGSMNDDNALVVANFGTFIHTLSDVNADYHVSVVAEDDGCILGSDAYIDNTFSASNAESTFETMADINLTLGSYGANTERGFSLAEAALAPDNIGPGGCNEGLYRENADLAIVHISDEPEQSVNPYTDYVSHFQSLKSDPDDVVIHAVAGDYPGGCGSASAGAGYYEATVATGGLFLSICATDWGSHLQELAEASAPVNDSHGLSNVPVPETIEVSIDGIRTTTGWHFDASINSIVFDPDHLPPVESIIEVEYLMLPGCQE